MIRKINEYKIDIRKEMRGGFGEVKVEHLFDVKNELQSNARLLAKLTLQPECSIGFHVHENEEEIFYIIQGEAEYSDNGNIVTVKAGDSMLASNGTGHSIKNIGKENLEVLATILLT